jgi:hypothetical protein
VFLEVLMKTIVLVALLAASGCSKKASSSDCDAPINKGMDNFAATVKSRGSNAPMQGAMLAVIEKLRTTFTQRCHDDQWAPEAAACFGTVASQREVQACEAKLTDPQRTKLTNEVREIMMSSMRMPTGVPGHPQMLQGSDGPAGASVPPSGAAPSGAAPAGAAPAGAAPSGAAPAGAAPSGAAPAGSAAGSGAAPAAGGSGGW